MKRILMMFMAISMVSGTMAQTNRTPDGNWLITGILIEGKMTDVSEKSFQLEFRGPEGRVGTKICNSISGKYSIKGEKIKFEGMISTKMMCPEMSFETAMNKAFADADHFKFSENKLWLLKGGILLLELTMPV